LVALGDLGSCAIGFASLAAAAWSAGSQSAARGLQGLLSNVFEARKEKSWVAGMGIPAQTAAINDCTACPPLPSTCRRCERVPPSPPHFPCPGDHYNVVTPVYNLNASTCTCFLDFQERDALCVSQCPDQDTVNRCF